MAQRPRKSNSPYAEYDRRLDALEELIRNLIDKKSEAGVRPEAQKNPTFCALPELPERHFSSDVTPERRRLIVQNDKKWLNGTQLKYHFMTARRLKGSKRNQEIVREGFQVWADVGIGISFEETDDIRDAEVRIGFLRGDGYWSYVGRDVLRAGSTERTMNFGQELDDDPRGVNVAVHEIGHTLGFPHEHQNPNSGIVWDRDAVLDEFRRSQGWDDATIERNILRKLNSLDVTGSDWDPDSVMHYEFGPGLIRKPDRFKNGISPAPGLSDQDKETIRRFYPKNEVNELVELPPFQSELLEVAPGEQKNFSIEPEATRQYTLRAFGGSDLLMVLFRKVGDTLVYVGASDDSGTPENATIEARLEAGQSYVLRVRLFAQYDTEHTAVMLW